MTGMGLTPSQAKVLAGPRTIARAVIGAPGAVVIIGGKRMIYLPVIEHAPVTLFAEAPE